MARKIKSEQRLLNVELDTNKPKEIDYDLIPNKKDGFVYVRKEVIGQVPLYKLGFINKIRVVLSYIDESTGRSAKRMEVKQAKLADKLSALEVTGYGFIADKIAPLLTRRNRVQGFQLDRKFDEVAQQLIIKSSVNNLELDILEVNPNYLKYCSNIPVVATVGKSKLDEI